MSLEREKIAIIIAGLIIGLIAGLLVVAGNPANMGFVSPALSVIPSEDWGCTGLEPSNTSALKSSACCWDHSSSR